MLITLIISIIITNLLKFTLQRQMNNFPRGSVLSRFLPRIASYGHPPSRLSVKLNFSTKIFKILFFFNYSVCSIKVIYLQHFIQFQRTGPSDILLILLFQWSNSLSDSELICAMFEKYVNFSFLESAGPLNQKTLYIVLTENSFK